ncbi:hypothetical protein BZA05DRAFT_424149 [Tricharina praecox]|uniref:uncharacterized protein n=1 Tax=Tricharina praecox TaxID=43433 RepID=UPI00221EF81D|nr:uncharacterized protein BZA05DRAFT_424149 [Tricharina praecox]KAI5856285.1 hypothetical protein BZA05DRAFT_424149 [Tricharina praecox]
MKYLSPVWTPNQFSGRVVFCTGGSGSICSVQVGALISLGANACIVGRDATRLSATATRLRALRPGAVVLPLTTDVRDAASLCTAADTCAAQLGSIDICILGAAGNFLAPISALSPNAFKSVVDIDLLGSYNGMKACAPHILRAGGGRFIFVSATLHYTGTPWQAHVSAAKAGVDALSAALAVEMGPRGVTSNVIAPGPIAGTEGMGRLLPQRELEKARRSVPLQRYGEPHEIADATVFLCSEAGSFVNGAVLVVDGGAWHRQGSTGQYPEMVLEGAVVEGVKGMKKENESKL